MYQMEFDFDPGTGTNSLAVSDGLYIVPFDFNGSNFCVGTNFWSAGTVPPAGHYSFTYTPTQAGNAYATYLAFNTGGSSTNSFMVDNISMCLVGSAASITSYSPDILSTTDYYAGGQEMPGRTWQGGDRYKYGFNGKEHDDEVQGSGNSLDFGARIYDARIGRFSCLNPLKNSFTEFSPYLFASNSPIQAIDKNGEYIYLVIQGGWGEKPTIVKLTSSNLSQIPALQGMYYLIPKGRKTLNKYLNNAKNDVYLGFKKELTGDNQSGVTYHGYTLYYKNINTIINNNGEIDVWIPSDRTRKTKEPLPDNYYLIRDNFNVFNGTPIRKEAKTSTLVLLKDYGNQLCKRTCVESVAHEFIHVEMFMKDIIDHHDTPNSSKQFYEELDELMRQYEQSIKVLEIINKMFQQLPFPNPYESYFGSFNQNINNSSDSSEEQNNGGGIKGNDKEN